MSTAYTQYLADPRTVVGNLAATLANYGLAPQPVSSPTTDNDHTPLTLADLPTNPEEDNRLHDDA